MCSLCAHHERYFCVLNHGEYSVSSCRQMRVFGTLGLCIVSCFMFEIPSLQNGLVPFEVVKDALLHCKRASFDV